MIHDVVTAEYMDGYRIKVTFDDGRDGIVDFSSYLNAGGVFDRFRDMEFFKGFTVDRELGVLSWGGEIDIAPETLYSRATGEPLPDWMVAEEPEDINAGE